MISAYGPGVTEARVRELRAAFEDLAPFLEVTALRVSETECVLHGRSSRAFALLRDLRGVGTMIMKPARHGAEDWVVAWVSRDELAALLTAHGRTFDAAKVADGPLDQPAPLGARLLVCLVDDDRVAVTWSQPMDDDRVIDLRRLL